MKTAKYTILAVIVVIILYMIISDKEEVQNCHINYNTEYVKVQPVKIEQPPKPTRSYDRFYDENMLVKLDSSIFDESKYKSIMKHTDDGELL